MCKACRRQFIEAYNPPSPCSDEFKRECLKMYVNGMGFRGIERIKGVHHTTVIKGILGWVLGDHSAETFRPLWAIVSTWQCYFYVTDGWTVYPGFIPDGDQIVSKTYMTRVEGENTRLRHYLARLHRKTLCYSKSVEMLKHSIRLLLHYLKFGDVPVPQ